MISVVRAEWCAEAERNLEPAGRGDLHLIRQEVEQGVSCLWRINGATDGWLVTRQEDCLGEIVLVAGAAKNCRPALEYFTSRITAAGFKVRTHITRPGLRRIYERMGYTMREMVMVIGVGHGQ